tara:strand:+ start:1005 stop:1751 length:747 start_codon:yes stop_codon:yes gene_type:complete
MKIEEQLKRKYLYSKRKSLPKLLYFFFQLFKSKFKSKKLYSNWGIDLLVKDILKKKKRGIYIDVGCHHPLINNNTNMLYKNGWKGINIDLDFNSIDMFNYFRPKDDNILSALSNRKGQADLYFFHNRAAKNTISKSRGAGARSIRKIEVNTLDNIIKNSKFKIKDIDFLSIDVEGNELNVLKGLNFKKYRPKIISIEFIKPNIKEFYQHNIKDIEKSNIYKFMIRKKYKLINWVHDDLVFISKTSNLL